VSQVTTEHHAARQKYINSNQPRPAGWGIKMPLVKSKSEKAFRENVKAEVKSKPVKQAIAIAYATKRAAPAKGKK
jgi:hypothetical protein